MEKDFILDALRKTAKIEASDIPVKEMIGSLDEYGYRNRTNFKLKIESSGDVKFGFFKEKSHEFLPITRCEISNEKVNTVISELSKVKLKERKYPSRAECELQEVEGGVLCGLSFHPKASKKEKRRTL